MLPTDLNSTWSWSGPNYVFLPFYSFFFLSTPLFCLSTRLQGGDYVVGEYVDMMQVHGSRRQAEKPYISPEALQAAPPPGMLAALAPPPSKKRKSVCESTVWQCTQFRVQDSWCTSLCARADVGGWLPVVVCVC